MFTATIAPTYGHELLIRFNLHEFIPLTGATAVDSLVRSEVIFERHILVQELLLLISAIPASPVNLPK